jgi:hypothetical protein
MGGSRATALFLIRGLSGRSERCRPSGARIIYPVSQALRPGLTHVAPPALGFLVKSPVKGC